MAIVDSWIATVEKKIEGFAKKHSINYKKSEREISASFEIGCFHALSEFYERNFEVEPANLTPKNEYRYLTTPSGNPMNFSYIRLRRDNEEFELRQQVRIRSHLDPDIAFTPDMVVIQAGTDINAAKDADYLTEIKADNQLTSEDVLEKAKAAVQYCKHASDHNLKNGGKEWKYLLIPHSEVLPNMSLGYLAGKREYVG